VWLAEYNPRVEREREAVTTSYTTALDWREQATGAFEAIVPYDDWSPSLAGDGDAEAERLRAALVHPDFFRAMRARPMLGRAFLPEEAREGSEIVVVLSHGLWTRRFGGDPSVVGRRIALSARPRLVVGVMPPGFRAPGELDAELWGSFPFEGADGGCRTCRHIGVIARLRAGASLERAREEMATVAARLAAAYPREAGRQLAAVVPVRERAVGNVRRPLWLILGAAGMVLLVACANLSNLLLARGLARSREMAVRVALGAGRGRVVRQVLAESLVLAAAGGAAGVALAVWVVRLVAALGPDTVRGAGVAVDWRVLAFAAAATIATGVAFGILPALRAAGTDVHEVLKSGARGATRGRGSRTRDALVVAQLAAAVALLAGAGLALRSFGRLLRVEPGIRTEGVLAMTLSLPTSAYPEPESWAAFHARLLDRIEALPGVHRAALTSNLPLSGSFDRIGFRVVGAEYGPGDELPEAERYIVTPGYFESMGVELVRGRLLGPDDRHPDGLVVVVDETLERQLWPGGSALGRRLGGSDPDAPQATVVGVVRHVRHYGLDVEGGGQLYLPFLALPTSYNGIVIRADGDPLALAAAVRREVRALDPRLPVFDVATMDERLAESTAARRFLVTLLGAFGAIAILVASVGLYGVIAYGVTQRRRELGVRMALGAQRADVVRLVVRHGVALAAAGVAIGTAGAVAAGRALRGLLFEARAADPAVLLGVPLVLAAVALLASWLPARRAARVEPVEAMRAD
jgi:putative ABC transport system permease protein